MTDPPITELKNTLMTYLMKSGQIPTEEELTESTEALLSFFEILIESNRKSNERQSLRNPDHTD